MTKLLRFFTLSLSLLLFSIILSGQIPEIEWQRCLGGKQVDEFVNAIEVENENIILLCKTNSCDGLVSNYHGDVDALIIKLASNGNIAWTKTWGGSGKDVPCDIVINPKDNTYLVLCESNSNDGDLYFKATKKQNVFVIGLNSNGEYYFNADKNYPGKTPDYKQVAKRIFQTKDFQTFVLHTISPLEISEDFDENNPKINQFLTNGVLPPGYFEPSDLSITPGLVGAFKVKSIYPGKSFMLYGNLSDPELNINNAHSIKTVTPKNFHKGGRGFGDHDACIISIYNGSTYHQSSCIGGSKNEEMLSLFETSTDHYRTIISSNSSDGDFKINYGDNDIWIVDLDENLSIKNKRNIGTPYQDKYLGNVDLGTGLFATLFNSFVKTSTNAPSAETSHPQNQISSSPNVISPIELLPDNNSAGLKLDISSESGNKYRLNLSLNDSNATLWGIGNNQLVIAANKHYNGDNDACLIGVDANTGKILWEKVFGGNDIDMVSKIIPARDGGFYALGTTKSNHTGTVSANHGQSDIWVIKLNKYGSSKEPRTVFQDNLFDNTISNALNDSSKAISDIRLNSFVLYQKDTTNLSALWTFAQASEYLADYDLAAFAYRVIIPKLDKIKNKSQISKARVHQITCKFLAQSENKTKTNKTEKETDPGYYGIGINYRRIANHLMINSLIPGKSAERAGIKPCDEFVSINGVAVSEDCLTNAKVIEKLRGEKDTYVNVMVKRFGVNKLLDFKLQRTFIASPPITKQPSTSAQEKNSIIGKKDSLNTNQVQSQTFLKKMVTTIQKDSSIMKNIETARKVSYALAILNKWADQPVSNKYLIQIDEQLGMVSSLISIIKGNNPNFTFDNNGNISFGNPELKELISKDYAKEVQVKFDSLALIQQIKETKIDDNISFVEKANYDTYSGYYECVESSIDYGNYSPCKPSEIWYKVLNNVEGLDERKYSLHYIKISGNNYTSRGSQILKLTRGGTSSLTEISTEFNGNVNFNTKTVDGVTTIETKYSQQTKYIQNSSYSNHATFQIEFMSNYEMKIIGEKGNWSIFKKVKD